MVVALHLRTFRMSAKERERERAERCALALGRPSAVLRQEDGTQARRRGGGDEEARIEGERGRLLYTAKKKINLVGGKPENEMKIELD